MELAKYRELIREEIANMGLIDGHAHNIVSLDSDLPFIKCFSEADGDALMDVPHTLSFKRSIREIAALYGCEATLDGIEKYRKSSGLKSICSKCFGAANISAIFIDDGITLDKMHEIEWHKSYAPTIGRMLRIEDLAQTILNQGIDDKKEWCLESFQDAFITKLKEVSREDVVAFKTVSAYRSGLMIDTKVDKSEAEAGLLNDLSAGAPVRLQDKRIVDYLLTCSFEVAISFDLPIQIHTGFGDKDLDLRLANPLHLRTLLEDERFTRCMFVLLHASYPFSKEASYLSSVYPNVYLDIGLAIPKLSVNGMVSTVKEILELAPLKKVMFSTDGYAFPETFYLGAKKAREIMTKVLCEACEDGDLSIREAIEAAQDIFRRNASRLYKAAHIRQSVDPACHTYQITRDISNDTEDDTVFIRMIWVDLSGQHRCRAVPKDRFYKVIKENGIGIPCATMGMTSHSDCPAKGSNLSGVGEIRLVPDLSTKHKLPWSRQEEFVLSYMQHVSGEAWEYCPRHALRRMTSIMKDEFNLEMNAGFENEFFLLKNNQREGDQEMTPFDLTPYCSTLAYDSAYSFLKEVYDGLQTMGISVEQLHSEAGQGQFEIVNGHTACASAADNLVFVRETVKAVARKHGCVATFLPKYFLNDIGSGSHAHLSLWRDGTNVFMASNESNARFGMSPLGEAFMAGVFYHLPSLLAFIAPLPNSYDRLQPNTWSGAYHCWGRENREATLRTACPPGITSGLVSNFEIKAFDGCANPHLGLAAILAAGIDGLRKNLTLPEPIDKDPSECKIGPPRLPESLQESVMELSKDEPLTSLLGKKLLATVIAIRKAEVAYYSTNKEAYKKLINRY